MFVRTTLLVLFVLLVLGGGYYILNDQQYRGQPQVIVNPYVAQEVAAGESSAVAGNGGLQWRHLWAGGAVVLALGGAALLDWRRRSRIAVNKSPCVYKVPSGRPREEDAPMRVYRGADDNVDDDNGAHDRGDVGAPHRQAPMQEAAETPV